MSAIDQSDSDVLGAVINIDGGEQKPKVVSAAKDKFVGEREVIYEFADSNAHDIVLKLFSSPASQWNGTAFIGLRSISVDDGGQVLPSVSKRAKKVEFIGDSWMAVQNDWPYMLDSARYSVQPLSYGGALLSQLDAQYQLNRKGEPAKSYQRVDAVVIGTGVNDFLRGVSVAAYEATLSSLTAKVRSAHPDAKIIYLQAPRNNQGRDYGQYGAAMARVADKTQNATYIPLPESRLADLEWRKDGLHLTYLGLRTFASVVEPLLDSVIHTDETKPVAMKKYIDQSIAR